MGSTFMSKDEAAKSLGVSERTVYRYIKSGYLRLSKDGNRTVILEDDINQLKLWLKKELDNQVPLPLNGITLTRLHAEIRQLRLEVDTIRRILNIKFEALDLTDAEIYSLYRMASAHSVEGWAPLQEQMWADTFLRLKHENLEQMEKVTKDPHPWRPFYRLCSTMVLSSYNKDKELKDQLAAGKSHLYSIATIWSDLHGGNIKVADSLISREAVPFKKLVRELGKKQEPDNS